MGHELPIPPPADRQPLRLHGALPFRLGTTSYVIPDDILPNLRYVGGRVDDVELVLFESDECSNMPSSGDIGRMVRLATESHMTFTVHLPLDIALGSADESYRAASVGKCRRVVDRMAPLMPFAWILHLHGDRRGDPPTDDEPRWLEQNRRSLAELLRWGPAPRMICIETLDYEFRRVAELVEAFDLSVCLDIGHLLANRRDVTEHLERWMSRARVFHVHGIDEQGKDHSHLGHLPRGLLEDLAARLARVPPGDRRVLTMEVFGQDDFERSLRTVAKRLSTWRK